MPLRDYECKKCEVVLKDVYVKRDEESTCNNCGQKLEALISTHGGYHIKGNNSASVRPKGAGSSKK